MTRSSVWPKSLESMSSTETKHTGGPSTISDAEDSHLSQAVRRSGRRNALGDLGEELAQGSSWTLSLSLLDTLCLSSVSASIAAAEMENIAPHFQSMSIKQWSSRSMQYASFLSSVSVHALCDRSSSALVNVLFPFFLYSSEGGRRTARHFLWEFFSDGRLLIRPETSSLHFQVNFIAWRFVVSTVHSTHLTFPICLSSLISFENVWPKNWSYWPRIPHLACRLNFFEVTLSLYPSLFLTVEWSTMGQTCASKTSNWTENFADLCHRIRIDIEGAPGTLYDGEKFQLLFKFTDQYPFDSPQVGQMSEPVSTPPVLFRWHSLDRTFLSIRTFIPTDTFVSRSSPMIGLQPWVSTRSVSVSSRCSRVAKIR